MDPGIIVYLPAAEIGEVRTGTVSASKRTGSVARMVAFGVTLLCGPRPETTPSRSIRFGEPDLSYQLASCRPHLTVPNFVPTRKPDELPESAMGTGLDIHLEVISSNLKQIPVVAVTC